jgi:hypothetical protein
MRALSISNGSHRFLSFSLFFCLSSIFIPLLATISPLSLVFLCSSSSEIATMFRSWHKSWMVRSQVPIVRGKAAQMCQVATEASICTPYSASAPLCFLSASSFEKPCQIAPKPFSLKSQNGASRKCFWVGQDVTMAPPGGWRGSLDHENTKKIRRVLFFPWHSCMQQALPEKKTALHCIRRQRWSSQ